MYGIAVYPELVHSLADDRTRDLKAAAAERHVREERRARRTARVRRLLAGSRESRRRPGPGPAAPATAPHVDQER